MRNLALAFAALLTAGTAMAECERPEPPSIPDGASASRDQMLSAHGDVKEYIGAGNSYLECLKEKDAAAVEQEASSDEERKAIEKERKARVERYNSVVDDMTQVGDDFNEELKKFNERQE